MKKHDIKDCGKDLGKLVRDMSIELRKLRKLKRATVKFIEATEAPKYNDGNFVQYYDLIEALK